MGPLAYALAAIAGIVDVAGFIALGGIFTAHVSGDTVVAGVAVAHADWMRAAERFAAVPLFVLGYFIGGTIVKVASLRGIRAWFSLGALAEALFLAGFALAHHWVSHGDPYYLPRGWEVIALTAPLAFAMGTQNALLNRVGSVSVHTTFVTGMTTGFAQNLIDWSFARAAGEDPRAHARKAAIHGSVWLAFAAGGCGGGWLQATRGSDVFYLPCVAMAVLALYTRRGLVTLFT